MANNTMNPGARDRARDYLREFPDKRNIEVAKELGVSIPTVAKARQELMEGKTIPDKRRGPYNLVHRQEVADEIEGTLADEVTKVLEEGQKEVVLTGGEVRALDLSNVDLDDDQTRKKMLVMMRVLAFNQSLSPDTRLAAMQAWTKMKDSARAKELGPGVPLTKEAAINRLCALFEAVGPDIVLAAVRKTFNAEKEAEDEREITTDETAITQSLAPTVETS